MKLYCEYTVIITKYVLQYIKKVVIALNETLIDTILNDNIDVAIEFFDIYEEIEMRVMNKINELDHNSFQKIWNEYMDNTIEEELK